jgi:hypothetical protein
MESRNVMWIGLAQVLAVVLGFVTLGVVLKFHGWPEAPFFRFYPLTTGLRLYGPWLLIVPVVWTICGLAAVNYGWNIPGHLIVLLGVLIAGVIGLSFLLAAANPGARSFLIPISPATSVPRTP